MGAACPFVFGAVACPVPVVGPMQQRREQNGAALSAAAPHAAAAMQLSHFHVCQSPRCVLEDSLQRERERGGATAFAVVLQKRQVTRCPFSPLHGWAFC